MSRIQSIQRNLLIVSKIRNSGYVSFNDLTDYVRRELAFRGILDSGTSRRTIQRDLQNIRTEFGIDIEYCPLNRGYYIADRDTKSDIDRLIDSFDILTSLGTGSGIPDFVLAEHHNPQGAKYLYPLIRAIKESVRVVFDYAKFWEGRASRREVEPYAIKEFNGRWYLVARTPGTNDLKTYGLDRIKELEISAEKFKTDDTVNIAELFRHSFGIFSTENYPIEKIVLSFDKYDGSYLKSLPLHPSQKIVKDEEDEFIIELNLRITADFVMAVLSRSWSVKVIEPQSLREEICRICRSAIMRNS